VPGSTSDSAVVVNSRISGCAEAASTSLTRSRAVDTLSPSSPVESAKRVLRMPSKRAFAFISWMNAALPAGWVRPRAAAARFSEDMSAMCSSSRRVSWLPTCRRECVLRR